MQKSFQFIRASIFPILVLLNFNRNPLSFVSVFICQSCGITSRYLVDEIWLFQTDLTVMGTNVRSLSITCAMGSPTASTALTRTTLYAQVTNYMCRCTWFPYYFPPTVFYLNEVYATKSPKEKNDFDVIDVNVNLNDIMRNRNLLTTQTCSCSNWFILGQFPVMLTKCQWALTEVGSYNGAFWTFR